MKLTLFSKFLNDTKFPALLLVLFILANNANAQLQRDQGEIISTLKQRSIGFVEAVISANVIGARAEMSETMKNTLTQQTTKTIAGDLTAKGGKLNSIKEPELFLQGNGHVVSMVPLDMGRQDFHAQVVFERSSKLAKVIGFSIFPHVDNLSEKLGPSMESKEIDTTPPPPYADAKLFKEEKITLERMIPLLGEPTFDSLVTVPLTASETAPVPLAILVPGIGANDENYTVGNSQIFRDIAYGLSTSGIATLRFPSASFRNPQPFITKNYGLKELYYRDLRELRELIKKDSRFDHDNTIMIGHNLGAAILTEVYEPETISRFIFLNPLPQDPETYVRSRVDALLPIVKEGSIEHQDLTQANELLETYAINELPSEPKLLNYPADVWKDWSQVNPNGFLKTSSKPALLVMVEDDQFLDKKISLPWNSVFLTEQLGRASRTYSEADHFLTITDPENKHAGYVHEDIMNDIILFIQKGRINSDY